MKSLFVMDSLSRANGGMMEAERRLQQTLHEEQGISINVLGLRDTFSDQDSPAWSPLEPTCCPVTGPGAIGYSPRLLPAMMSAEADLAYFAGLWKYPSMAGLAWARRTSKPYIVAPHGMLDPWAVRNSGGKKKLAGWLFQNRHLRKAACLRALCASEVDSIRRYGLTNPICVIPNGIDLPDLPPQHPETAAPRTLLFLGRLHPKKGLPGLIEAWGKLKPANWNLAIAGWDQGGHEADLQRHASALGMVWDETAHLRPGSTITFLGPRFGEKKKEAYAQCDAFILPSLSEGLPMTILEAWSYGKPVVMTPECNLPEGFSAEAAIRIETQPESLHRGIRLLFEMTPDERRQMGMRGRALAQSKFSWQTIGGQMAQVYAWVARKGSKPDCVA
jgi:glycosyltransferase involved in cell wall biosynthesis